MCKLKWSQHAGIKIMMWLQKHPGNFNNKTCRRKHGSRPDQKCKQLAIGMFISHCCSLFSAVFLIYLFLHIFAMFLRQTGRTAFVPPATRQLSPPQKCRATQSESGQQSRLLNGIPQGGKSVNQQGATRIFGRFPVANHPVGDISR